MIQDLYKKVGDTFAPPPETGDVRLPNGFTLYWKMTEQGREYYSDEVGGGVIVWHTALVDQSTLLAAIVQEQAFQKLEYVIESRAKAKKLAEVLDEVREELTKISKHD